MLLEGYDNQVRKKAFSVFCFVLFFSSLLRIRFPCVYKELLLFISNNYACYPYFLFYNFYICMCIFSYFDPPECWKSDCCTAFVCCMAPRRVTGGTVTPRMVCCPPSVQFPQVLVLQLWGGSAAGSRWVVLLSMYGSYAKAIRELV